MIAELTIREAQVEDVVRIIELGREFLLKGPYKDQIRDNPDQVVKLIKYLFENQQAARILIGEEEAKIQGVFCFVIYPHYFSGELCANELIWYVDPEHRGRLSMELLWAAEKMAHELGAIRMQLTAPTPKVGEIYERCKYKMVEVGYQALLESRVNHKCPQ